MQREIEKKIKEQENSSLWQDSSHENFGENKRTPKENFFLGIGNSQFVDPDSPLNWVASSTMATKVQATPS
jgi:hypothetical protein